MIQCNENEAFLPMSYLTVIMGNLFRKKREQNHFIEDGIRKRYSVQFASTSITPFPVLSFDEYIRNDLHSVESSSLHARASVFNSDQSDTSDEDVEKIESTILTVEYLENLYTQYNAVKKPTSTIGIHMDVDGLNEVRHLFELLQSDMIYKVDNYKAFMKTEVDLIEKYSDNETDKEEYNAEQMFLRHFIKMIITYKMILDHIEMNRAKGLLQQLATCHSLLDIKGDYKAMNLHILKYFLQRKLIDSGSIISLVSFLSLVSDEMENILEPRISKLEMDRKQNKTPDNYRCMKNWSQVVYMINMRTNIIQKQIRIHNTEEKLVETVMKKQKKRCYGEIAKKNKAK